MSYEMLNIPSFKGCKNCGQCCGPVPVSQEDIKTIKKYIKEHDIKPNPVENSLVEIWPVCTFRDEKAKKCMIYPVRPLMCRVFRCDDSRWIETLVTKYLEYLPPIDEAIIQNSVNWEEEEE